MYFIFITLIISAVIRNVESQNTFLPNALIFILRLVLLELVFEF